MGRLSEELKQHNLYTDEFLNKELFEELGLDVEDIYAPEKWGEVDGLIREVLDSDEEEKTIAKIFDSFSEPGRLPMYLTQFGLFIQTNADADTGERDRFYFYLRRWLVNRYKSALNSSISSSEFVGPNESLLAHSISDNIWGSAYSHVVFEGDKEAGLDLESLKGVEERFRILQRKLGESGQLTTPYLSLRNVTGENFQPECLFDIRDFHYKYFGDAIKKDEEKALSIFLASNYLTSFHIVQSLLQQPDYSAVWSRWVRSKKKLLMNSDSHVSKMFFEFWEGGMKHASKEVREVMRSITRDKKSKESVASRKSETVASVEKIIEEPILSPSFKPRAEDVLNNKIPAPKEIPEGCTLKARITQASKRGIYKVPPEKQQEFSAVELIQNEDRSFSFPKDLDWQQEGKKFGFEFFFERLGRKSDFMSMVKVEVPADKKVVQADSFASWVLEPPKSVESETLEISRMVDIVLDSSEEPLPEPTRKEKEVEAFGDILSRFNPSWIELSEDLVGAIRFPEEEIDTWNELSGITLPKEIALSASFDGGVSFEGYSFEDSQFNFLADAVTAVVQDRKDQEAALKVQKEVDSIRDSFPLLEGVDVSKFKESNYIYNGTGHFIWNQKSIHRAVRNFLDDLKEKVAEQDYVLFYTFNGRLGSLTLRKRGKQDTNTIKLNFISKDDAVDDKQSRLDISVTVEGQENLSSETQKELYQLGQCLTKYIGTEISKILADKKFDELTKGGVNNPGLKKKAREFEDDRKKRGSRVRLLIGEFNDLDLDPDLRKIEVSGKDLETEYERLVSEGRRVGILYENHRYSFLNSRVNGFTTMTDNTIQNHYDSMMENRVHRNIFMERALATLWSNREFHKDRGPFLPGSLAHKALLDWKDDFEIEKERELIVSDLQDVDTLKQAIGFFSQYKYSINSTRIEELESAIEVSHDSDLPEHQEALEDYKEELAHLGENSEQVGAPLRYNPYVIVSLGTHKRLLEKTESK